MSFVFRKWGKYCQKKRINTAVGEIVTNSTNYKLANRMLIVWRTELYLMKMLNTVALPFREKVVKMNQKRLVLNALKDRRASKLLMEEKKKSSFEYYRFSLVSKVLETLKWYHERTADRNNKIEFMR